MKEIFWKRMKDNNVAAKLLRITKYRKAIVLWEEIVLERTTEKQYGKMK